MKKILVTVAAASVLAAGGAATALAAEDDGERGDRRVTDVKITAEQAAAAALKAVPGGRIESIELDDDDAGKRTWDVDVLSGNTFRDEVVDANTGTVATNRQDDDRDDRDGSDDRDDARRLNAAKIDAVQAARTALRTAKGTVTSVDLDDDGRSWEVELTGADGTERDLRIDTATGKVTANTADADDDNDDQSDDADDDDRDGEGDDD
ncbi:PepSY domain-containing protein [Actinomadura sp. 21ATH]|uniref:PepSY domain-containing protein n=1 Tax=Actinomadura sp. 21ATH TaxID=1735444 RepID=UPI0035C082B7